MPTSKTRINLTVSSEMERQLKGLAKSKSLPVTTVAFDLLQQALEIEEDDTLLRIATERETQRGTFVSHTKAWG